MESKNIEINTQFNLNNYSLDLFSPSRLIELIEREEISDLIIINKYNEVLREFNRVRFDKGKHIDHDKFINARSKFIDMMKERSERQ